MALVIDNEAPFTVLSVCLIQEPSFQLYCSLAKLEESLAEFLGHTTGQRLIKSTLR